MTTFLFSAVAVSGLAIVARAGVPFTRRNRFILTAGLALGFGATLVPGYFGRVFEGTAEGGDNRALRGFLDAISLVMETGFAVTAVVTVVLNLALPVELEDDIAAAAVVDEDDDGSGRAGSGSGSGVLVAGGASGDGNGSGYEGAEMKGGKLA